MVFSLLRRKRLLLWILRAYIKKRRKTLLLFFILGILLTIALLKFLPNRLNLAGNTEVIGLVGSYTIDTLPLEIQHKISLGLTKLEDDGTASPSIAASWEISPDAKTYTVTVRDDIYFQDGTKLNAFDVNYNFKDARSQVLDERTIQFTLNEPFSPFPTVISQPIFKKGLVGVGDYTIKKTEFNGPFISSLTLQNAQDGKEQQRLVYRFYPTEEAVNIAFVRGETDTIKNLYTAEQFQSWPNVEITRVYTPNEMVAIFFNTRDAMLSQKNIRQALVFSLPDNFEEGQAASTPLSFTSFAYQKQSEKFLQDFSRAKKLLGNEKDSEESPSVIKLTVDERLERLAIKLAKHWQQLGIRTDLEIVKTAPAGNLGFQAFLGIFRIPKDPDQYVLWHSTQEKNITGYANPKIDKLLEDGRKTQDKVERERIYGDFQKYLVDDAPAAFLYYPAVYTVKRR